MGIKLYNIQHFSIFWGLTLRLYDFLGFKVELCFNIGQPLTFVKTPFQLILSSSIFEMRFFIQFVKNGMLYSLSLYNVPYLTNYTGSIKPDKAESVNGGGYRHVLRK
ncbi:MAG: hypothetical protein ACI9S8_003046 [Chlamydiales bacterium]|jgi:hypothetical protein